MSNANDIHEGFSIVTNTQLLPPEPGTLIRIPEP